MSWRCWLADTMSGLIDVPIDIPQFSWSLSVSDSSLSTTRDKGTGDANATGLQLPLSALPASTREDLSHMLTPERRALCLCWDDGSDLGVPLLWGIVGEPTVGWSDVSFDLISPLSAMSRRIAVRERSFGTGSGSTSPDTITYRATSFRGILASLGILCTRGKPGGELPIDWLHADEAGIHDRTYAAYDAANLSWADIAKKIANVSNGIDFQFRPYWADSRHVRLSFEAGTDTQPALGQTAQVPTLTAFAGGGTLEDLKVACLGPVMRVYGTGSGTDEATLCHLSQDLTLCARPDPWPLVEMTHSDTDSDSADLVSAHADAILAASRTPLVQLTGEVSFSDEGGICPGAIWPGQLVDVDVRDHPWLPEGTYRLRLMEMSGTQSDHCQLTFDQIVDPWYDPSVYR